MRRVAVIAAAVLVVFSARQATADEPSVFPLRKVVLQLKWRHQFQFAGYYAAKAQGYYAKAGLDVEIVPGAPDVVTVNEVISGRADFGVGGAELVLEYALGRDVVMLATIFQHSPSVLLVRSDRGILSPHDLAMRRVMLERGLASADILALLAAEGLDEQDFSRVNHSFDLTDLVEGRVDAVHSYNTDEPYELINSDVPHHIIYPSSYGIDFYGDGLFTCGRMVREAPEVVDAFLDASLEGWRYAMNHSEEVRYEPGSPAV
jgi:ABC-type nitrate/sulfonate/bicarbonate transport system substrate-binding protein